MCVIAIIDCQFDYICNELKHKNGRYTCEKFMLNLKWEDLLLFQIFEVGRHTFTPNLEVGRHT